MSRWRNFSRYGYFLEARTFKLFRQWGDLLVDLLDRLLAGGVVLTGDITLAIADIDMVRIFLRALITSLNRSTRFGAAEQNA